jgi:hypothetical protein
MVRYDLCAIVIFCLLALFCCPEALADTQFGDMNLFGFPMAIVAPDASAAGVSGQGFSYLSEGYTLPDLATTYGVESQETSPVLGGTSNYFGLNGGNLGVTFGVANGDHDSSDTSYSKALNYEASLENTFIGFPGYGVGSVGVSFPTISDQKSTVKYSESVSFEFSTESNKFQVGGFGFPLGLGLGYTAAQVGTDPGLGIFNNSYFFA